MSNSMKVRLHATTAMIGISGLVLTMGAPWKFT